MSESIAVCPKCNKKERQQVAIKIIVKKFKGEVGMAVPKSA